MKEKVVEFGLCKASRAVHHFCCILKQVCTCRLMSRFTKQSVYLNTTKTPKLRKDTQSRTKTRKDSQRHARTRKDVQRHANFCVSLSVFVCLCQLQTFFLLRLRVFVCLCASLPVFACLCVSLRSSGVFAVFR